MQDLGTVAGIAAMASVITEVLKRLTGISGRGSQIVAVATAITLAVAARLSGVGTDAPWLEIVLNGILAGAASIGVYEAVAYKE